MRRLLMIASVVLLTFSSGYLFSQTTKTFYPGNADDPNYPSNKGSTGYVDGLALKWDDKIHVGKPTIGGARRGFIYFDITDLPYYARVQDVKLKLYPFNKGGSTHILEIHELISLRASEVDGVNMWNDIKDNDLFYRGYALGDIKDQWVTIDLNSDARDRIEFGWGFEVNGYNIFGIGLKEGYDSENNSQIYGYTNSTYKPKLVVTYIVPSSITISGDNSVNENSTASYSCTANYSDGTNKDVTSSASWQVSNYATISSSGVLSANSVSSDKSCTITASYGGKSDTHTVTIKNVAATVTSISISGSPSVNENSTASYSCTANYSDGTNKDVTSSASWQVSNYATISSSGVLSTNSVSSDKSCTITASYGGKSDTHTVTIKNVAATVTSISISGSPSVNENSTASYSCTANYSDGTNKDVTSSASWQVSNYATISSSGVLSTNSVSSDKSCTITASYGGKSDTHTVTIKNVAATVTSISISGSPSVNENSTASYSCTANYSDGTNKDVTSSASWQVSNYATISSSGVLSTNSVSSDKSCTITASYGGKSDTHTVTIKNVAATVTSISISGSPSVNENSTASYSCTANYSDGTNKDVTSSASWQVSNYATISSSGVLSTNSVSSDKSCTITASYGGKSDTHTVTIKNVAAPTLPNLKPYKPSNWDYPIVPSNITGTHTLTNLMVNEIAYIDWACINDGDHDIDVKFSYRLYLDDKLLHSWYSNSLKGGSWASVSDYNVVVETAGLHVLKLIVDPNNDIEESDETDNEWSKEFYWGSSISDQIADSLVLVKLYNECGGLNWTNKTNWLSSNLADWYGIEVKENRVTRIDLNENNLVGIIPEEIGLLSNLNYLKLRENKLSGDIPIKFWDLTELTHIDFWDNQLSGSLPQEIGNLSKLKSLNLGYNNLSGEIPEALGLLEQLNLIIMYENNFSGIIPIEIGNLTNLTDLWLNNNNLIGSIPSELGGLTNLSGLSLYENQLTGIIPEELKNLTELRLLYLHRNQLSGNIPEEIGLFEKLEHFFFYRNNFNFDNICSSKLNERNSVRYQYSPQAKLQAPEYTKGYNSGIYTLSVSEGHENNIYHWYKDGAEISGANERLYTIPDFTGGTYLCKITNSLYPELTLESEPIIIPSTVGIEDNDLSKGVSMFPNPTQNSLAIELHDSPNGQYRFEIYNLQGLVLESFEEMISSDTYRKEIDCSNLASGNYILKIISDKGIYTKMFTVMH